MFFVVVICIVVVVVVVVVSITRGTRFAGVSTVGLFLFWFCVVYVSFFLLCC